MRTRMILSLLLLATVPFVSCSDDETPVGPTDTIPPSEIADLAAGSPSGSSITLTWTAPGDDGNVLKASEYDVRYSTAVITAENFGSAAQFSGAPDPTVCGETETCEVTGLNSTTTYYFAVKTADEAENWSGISNVVSATTYLSGEWTVYTADNSGLQNNGINAIEFVPGIGTFFGTDSGTALIYGLTWTLFDTSNSTIASDHLSALEANPSGGSLWVGTHDDGICYYNGFSFVTYADTNSDLSNNAIQCLAVNAGDSLWVSTLGGLFCYDITNEIWSNLNASNSDLLSNLLGPIALETDGDLWIGYNYGGASLFNGTDFEHFNSGDGFTSTGVASICVADDNTVWFGTEQGIFSYNGSSWQNFNTSNSDLVSDVVFSVGVDLSGDVWAATNAGVCRFNGSSTTGWTVYTTENSPLPSNQASVMARDSTGRMWIGTEGGVAVFND